jgi:hypothetical protein
MNFKSNKQITAVDLALYHPLGKKYYTDSKYVGLANALLKGVNRIVKDDMLDAAWCKQLVVELTLHFEDTVADAGIWRAFCCRHKELYGKWLPFGWADEDFDYTRLSLASCKFMIWKNLEAHPSGRLVMLNPRMPFIDSLAEHIFAFLNSLFDDFDINDELLNDLYADEHVNDAIGVRNNLRFMCFESYLSRHFMVVDRLQRECETFSNILRTPDFNAITYAAISNLVFVEQVGPLAIFPKDWYADMLQSYSEKDLSAQAQHVRDMEYLPMSYYKITNITDTHISFQSLEDKHIDVLASSFQTTKGFSVGQVCMTSFFNFNGEWNVNGMCVNSANGENFEGRMADITAQLEKKTQLKKLTDDFCEAKGQRIFYFDSYDKVLDFFHNDVKIGDDDLHHSEVAKEVQESDALVVFFSELDGMPQVYTGLASQIYDERNPFNKSTEVQNEDFPFLDLAGIKPSCVNYLVKHGYFKNYAYPTGNLTAEEAQALLQDNIDFAARYNRREFY